MVSSLAPWVAISYRLAACFTRIGSRLRVELKFIDDRSSILGNYNYFLRKIAHQKMTKMGRKLVKNIFKKCAIFAHFRI